MKWMWNWNLSNDANFDIGIKPKATLWHNLWYSILISSAFLYSLKRKCLCSGNKLLTVPAFFRFASSIVLGCGTYVIWYLNIECLLLFSISSIERQNSEAQFSCENAIATERAVQRLNALQFPHFLCSNWHKASSRRSVFQGFLKCLMCNIQHLLS